ncbi:hypothetical protein [Burkholderia vietnamiensis]|uniref:hypothetical protein n=2 Tax=Burkholderia vietnamiensis TaxID=60552 RepID=UPI0030C839B6
MAMSDDLKFKLIVTAVGAALVYVAARKVGNGLSSAGQGAIDTLSSWATDAGSAVSSAVSSVENAAGEGVRFVANLPDMTWQNMQAYAGQRLQNDLTKQPSTMPFQQSAWDGVPMGL